jgi:plastocyanin domain-containing protein
MPHHGEEEFVMRRLLWVLCIAGLAGGCGGGDGGDTAGGGSAEPQRVALSVTENGFEPASVKVKAGQPVTLAVTRKTDQTCATEIVIPDHNIKRDLPLNQTVEVTFTPSQSGEVNYACGMDMIKGKVIVD